MKKIKHFPKEDYLRPYSLSQKLYCLAAWLAPEGVVEVTGIGGRTRPEWVVEVFRNHWSNLTGMGGRSWPEYAYTFP